MARVFSGVQSSGSLHLGNYLGAIKNWVALQQEHECIFCIVDLHAITVSQEPAVLKEHIYETAAFYLACGLDPKKNILFVQSEVPQHAELAWILNTIARMSELRLMHQFKEKSAGKEENISVGLFDYPVLMAADILLYQTELVPVGEDQLQHIELARELARRFNTRFGETFVLPQGRVPKMGARIMALDNPEKKMSKSATSALGYIAMTDEPALIIKKIQRAETDSGTDIVMSQDKPAISNLLAIYHLLSGESVKDLEKKYRDVGYGVFKKDLADVVVAHLSPIREKYREFLDDRHELEKILRKGSERAEGIAAETLRTAKERVGLGL